MRSGYQTAFRLPWMHVFGPLLVACTAITAAHPAAAFGFVDVATLAGGFIADLERTDRCKSLPEVARGAGAKLAMGVLGATAGGIAGLAWGGSGAAVKGAVLGGAAGAGADALADAAGRPIGAVRTYEFGLCQIIRHGQDLRGPVVDRLVDDLSSRCDLPALQFKTDASGAFNRLMACAASKPNIKLRFDSYVNDIAAINYGTCRAAVRFTESADAAAVGVALHSGGSAMPRIVPTCDARAAEDLWNTYYRTR